MATVGFFISYTGRDLRWAKWTAWVLKEAAYGLLVQFRDFGPGENFVVGMEEGVGADRTIALLSPDYLKSGFCTAEWTAVFTEDPTGEKGKLVVVRVGPCEPPKLLKPRIYIDLVGVTEEAEARRRLLEGLRRERVEPSSKPAFPEVPAELSDPGFPGALPAIWNLPRRNPNFTGREDLLGALRQSLVFGHHAALTQALVGLGGLGKTQCAIEYAHRHAGEYQLAWWARSEEPAQLASDYAALAAELGLPERNEPDQRVIVAAVRRWLEHHGGWLLIFDNVPHPDALKEYLPARTLGHVIITSRDPNWSSAATATAQHGALYHVQGAPELRSHTAPWRRYACSSLPAHPPPRKP